MKSHLPSLQGCRLFCRWNHVGHGLYYQMLLIVISDFEIKDLYFVTFYMKQVVLHFLKIISRSFFLSFFFFFLRESDQLTKCHLRFFQNRSWGLFYVSDHQPICDGSCKTSCWYIYGTFH